MQPLTSVSHPPPPPNAAANQSALVKEGALHVLAAVTSACARSAAHTTRSAASAGAGTATAHSGDGGGVLPVLSVDAAGHAIVQTAGVLRNLAVQATHPPAFACSGVLGALREAASTLAASADVVLAVARVLSKLSLFQECQVRAQRAVAVSTVPGEGSASCLRFKSARRGLRAGWRGSSQDRTRGNSRCPSSKSHTP
eukprot:351369-Chlamydomonas_euryale.AAC.8